MNVLVPLAEGFEEILRRWRKYMWGLDRQAVIVCEDERVRGAITGVDSTGALVLRDADGNRHIIRAADAVNIDIE